MVRFDLKRGPFCPKTWSVLSLTWVVLSCRGPFCPWSVLSMVRYVPNSVLFPFGQVVAVPFEGRSFRSDFNACRFGILGVGKPSSGRT